MIAQVEKTLLLLAEPVVVFAGRRVECRSNTVAFALWSLLRTRRRSVRMVGNHEPATHVQKHLARGCCNRDRILVGATPGATSKVVVSQRLIEVIERHGLREERLVLVVRREMEDKPSGAEDVAAIRGLLMRPASHRGRADKANSSCSGRGFLVLAHRDANNIRCVRLQNDRVSVSLENHAGVLGMEC